MTPSDAASGGFIASSMVGLITENQPILTLESDKNEQIREEFYYEQVHAFMYLAHIVKANCEAMECDRSVHMVLCKKNSTVSYMLIPFCTTP